MLQIKPGLILREPLLHFLLLGAALFVLYYEVADPETGDDNLIVVRVADIERLNAGWERRWGRPALPHERDALVTSFIREEVLNREARALGLEVGDGIIRRRLAQKMEFLFSDLADQVEITEEDLQSYLDEHPDRFRSPATATFSHVYFSTDRRADGAWTDAGLLLDELQSQDGTIDLVSQGDPFMYQYQFSGQSEAEVARLFGRQFAGSLFTLKSGSWTGPVESGFGVHLVRVEARTDSRLPSLDEVRDDVAYELKSQRQKDADSAFYKNLEQRYRVEIEEPDMDTQEVAL